MFRSLALVLLLVGCDALLPAGQVSILIDPKPNSTCWLDSRSGTFEYDETYGTTVDGTALMWPQGYTARRVGSEVEVYDARGRLRATTGEIGYFSGAWYQLDPPVRGLDRVWLTC